MSITSHLSGGIGRETRLEVHDRGCVSWLSRVADSHACHSAWTSRQGKACGDEVRGGRTAWIARQQRAVIGSHDVFIVLFIVALIVRDMAELTESPLDVVVCVVECAGSNCASSVGCREWTVSWVEVVVVFGEHGVSFNGAELVDVDAIGHSWLVVVDAIDVVLSQKNKERRDTNTHP